MQAEKLHPANLAHTTRMLNTVRILHVGGGPEDKRFQHSFPTLMSVQGMNDVVDHSTPTLVFISRSAPRLNVSDELWLPEES